MANLKSYLSALLYILFPDNCLACGGVIEEEEDSICSICRFSLAKTNFHLDDKNIVAQKFWGRTKLNYAISYLFFRKEGDVQNLLHGLKYNNQPQVGEILGNWYAQELMDNDFYKNFDIIIPVPMHPKKLKKRGYNQSAYFGKGLAEIWKIPQLENGIKKLSNTLSQTKKSRQERYDNMKAGFEITDLEAIKNKNILLVDDVITTGATLEACANLLLKGGAKTVSIATIAAAQS
ncbi:putative amidophosphoribosyltransferase [Bernardetia litoralis DSM 6794]|uniref:Putative amidophosphoribosyltransferase n=1 Tax=Bernardetia litoralis (strain ATCC 23117 / DSM 6794 / NBRC 15988 / NCIMB 1366 / Fx l1 / Sio-4) TaxID=880071 RepID=I4AGB7_BERLS|nr:ComF family protein [Bernardetia litoralis]AFM03002.1 putative amidophosphoribosyltransferase [Bernardetia litoralis DSM 6794]